MTSVVNVKGVLGVAWRHRDADFQDVNPMKRFGKAEEVARAVLCKTMGNEMNHLEVSCLVVVYLAANVDASVKARVFELARSDLMNGPLNCPAILEELRRCAKDAAASRSTHRASCRDALN